MKDELQSKRDDRRFTLWREKMAEALGFDPVEQCSPGKVYKAPDRYERLVAVAKEQEARSRELVDLYGLEDRVTFEPCKQTSREHWPLEMTYYVPVEKATGRMLLESDLLKMGGVRTWRPTVCPDC